MAGQWLRSCHDQEIEDRVYIAAPDHLPYIRIQSVHLLLRPAQDIPERNRRDTIDALAKARCDEDTQFLELGVFQSGPYRQLKETFLNSHERTQRPLPMA